MSRQTMDSLVLLGCISLWAGLALAEVGSFSNCTEYFYRGAEPSGLHTPRTAEICQRYKNQYRFATLYDKANRIPRWSAYILHPSNCPGQPWRLGKWFMEPQLRSNQAVSKDYEDTSYDQGHLNPNSFQCDENHRATFTLTNAAPMNPCFNRIHWSKVERTLKTQLTGNCSNLGGTPYLMTGAVPSNNVKIPIQDEDKEWDRDRPYNRVSVPSHLWTAVCCNHQDKTHKFSFAFLGENKEESKLSNLSVDQLNEVLPCLYNTPGQIKIFKDDCGSKSQKGQEVLLAIKSALYNTFQILLSDSYSQLLPPVKMINWTGRPPR
ncbi:zinc finger protein 576 [Platysternon megacephalum]|uniref:Zinc finger protein 576 n=1 Tax=Platysternon megacephalum TaxID=55544 RepID=A0A4D9DJU7_9SAUR|nr:zinc finger protein 576 [Platysternon megacephalum]